MKVLFCAGEALPFISTGGLGDVAGSLPQALRIRLIGCRVVIPLYEDIPQEMKDNMKFITSLSVPVAWRRQYCGVFETRANGVIYYLLDNQYYFKRKGIYGHFDDAERFAFFSRAILEMLPYIDFKPDLIHCNDWQTALVPVYLRLFYANDWYAKIKTLLTIHNIQYQGKYGKEVLSDVLGIPDRETSLLEYDNFVNLLKGGIECAHWVSTVSPTYAQEILDPWFACGLEHILKDRAWKLSGILNGIDTKNYTPETDTQIYKTYCIEDISGKAMNKQQLQERLSLEQTAQAPLISMVTRLVSHKGIDLVQEVLDQLLETTNAQFVVLGSGEWEYEQFFKMIQEKYPGRVSACFGFIPELSRKIYAGSDIFLMPSKSEPCGLSQMIALRYGTIPIVRETGGLKDSIFDFAQENGNGFTFKEYESKELLQTILRAIDAFNDKETWSQKIHRAMACDNSWGSSANKYIKLYKSILKTE